MLKRKKNGSIAVFLDRDGTINLDKNYVNHPRQLELIPGASQAIRMINENGLKAVVVSNQSGVARGYLTLRILGQIHRRLRLLLKRDGARLDAIYYCPYHPDQKPACRKPETGMALEARKDLGIELDKSYMIGDNRTDMEFGKNFGAKTVLVLTGKAKGNEPWIGQLGVNCVAEDILGGVLWVLQDLG